MIPSARSFLLLGTALMAAPLFATDPPVQARLVPNPVGLEDVATLEVTFEGSHLRAPSLNADFQLENLEILFGPSKAQNFQWVNGETSLSVTLTWKLRPLQIGRARVHGLQVVVGRDILQLADLETEVVEGSLASPLSPGARRKPFSGPFGDPFEGLFQPWEPTPKRHAIPKVRVVAEVEPASGWVGEQRTWRLVLLTQGDVSSFQPKAMPDFRGFWSREVKLPERVPLSWVEVDGERYARQVMLAKALYPLQPGTLEIDSVPVEVVIRVVSQGFGGFFAQPVLRKLETGRVRVGAKPLPPGAPGFQGPVGDLVLQSRLDRSEVRVGEAATWTVELESNGQLSSLETPQFTAPTGLRLFPPKTELSERTASQGRLQERLVWSFVLIAEEPGTHLLPNLTIPFFEPRAGEYRQRNAKPATLTVLPGLTTETQAASQPLPAAVPAADPARGSGATPSMNQLLAGGGILLGLLLLTWIGIRKRSVQRTSPTRRQLLAELEAAASEPPRAAAERLQRAWQAFLWAEFGLALDQPIQNSAKELQTRDETRAFGAGLQRVDEEIRAVLEAPALADLAGQLGELLERSRQAVRTLR